MGAPPIYGAIYRPCILTTKVFIDWKADLTIRSKNGLTPLDLAQYRRKTEIIELLEAALDQKSYDKHI